MSAKRFFQACLIFMLVLTSFVMARPTHAWGICGATYVVQRGDWLSRIARNCGVTLSALYAANPWASYQYYIYPGQVLVIPDPSGGVYNNPGGASCGPSWDSYGSYYVVCRGDTLSAIAMYYGVTVYYLQTSNGIWNPNIIYAGQVIRV